jgi:RHS repeat-associated protein
LNGRGTSINYNRDGLPAADTLPTGVDLASRLAIVRTYAASHAPMTVALNMGRDRDFGRRYTYDVGNRLSTVTWGVPHRDGPLTLRDETRRTLSYDVGGPLSGFSDVHYWEELGPLVCPNPQDPRSCYRQVNPRSSTLRQATYSYDKLGNRTDLGGVAGTGNRLTSFDGYTLSYDDDGNLLRKLKAGVWDQTFAWNNLGQLVQVTTNGVVTSYGYDGWGRRIRKSTGTQSTRYVYDDDDLVAELNGAGILQREFVYHPGTDRPHSMRRSDGATFYYVTELPGHVAGLVDGSNNVVNKYEYTPFGESLAATEGTAQPLRYGSREYDPDTKLYYNRARFYDPHQGRFISQDPIGLAGGVNIYVYAANDPGNQTDPFGLDNCHAVKVEITDEDGMVHKGTLELCSGGGSTIGQILDYAALWGVGSGSEYWAGGVFATSGHGAGMSRCGPEGCPRRLERAIYYLINETTPLCQAMGRNALARFRAGGYVFDDLPNRGMTADPDEGTVTIYRNGMNLLGLSIPKAAGAVAHEELHFVWGRHTNPFNTRDEFYRMEDQCARRFVR